MRFVWDGRKASANIRKHSVGFDEASTVFGDALSITVPDPDHSLGEHRFVTVGVSSSGRLLVVSHLDAGSSIRLISARPASRHEKRSYES